MGFTPEQRFFLGWAQVWAAKYTPEAERLQVLGNPHALPKWRVNGPMSNMPTFAQSLGCKQGSKMIRQKVCEICSVGLTRKEVEGSQYFSLLSR